MSKTVDASSATAAAVHNHRSSIHRNLHLKMPNNDRFVLWLIFCVVSTFLCRHLELRKATFVGVCYGKFYL